MTLGIPSRPMRTRLERRWPDSTSRLSAGRPSDFSLGASQNAIRVVVFSSAPLASRLTSRLDDFGPAPSLREPASVGLKHSAQNGPGLAQSNELADCNCRPWSWLSMNSLPFQVSEWM